MNIRILEAELWVSRKPEDSFPFFADASNLSLITPPWLRFEILTPKPISMGAGAEIDYKLTVSGIPVRWSSEITVWEPPFRFVDVQRRGPYRLWEHHHTFEGRDGGTVIRDRVRYAVPGGFLEPLIHRFFVGPDLEKIFTFRKGKILALFGEGAESNRSRIGEGAGQGRKHSPRA